MTEPMHDDARLEIELRSLGAALGVPVPSAGFAAAVMARIENEAPRRERPPLFPFPRVRRSVLLAIAATLILAAVAAAAIGFNLPGLRILFGPPPSLQPSSTPHGSAEGLPGSLLGLGSVVSLEDAQSQVDFELTMPTDPNLGPPAATYIRLGRVALVWAPSAALPATSEDPEIGLLLNEFHGTYDTEIVEKLIHEGTRVEQITVDGAPGYWIFGAPHFFAYIDEAGQRMEDTYRSVGQTLVWTRDGITYRLETGLDRDAAIRLAASLR